MASSKLLVASMTTTTLATMAAEVNVAAMVVEAGNLERFLTSTTALVHV
jgi:hypothetical protein